MQTPFVVNPLENDQQHVASSLIPPKMGGIYWHLSIYFDEICPFRPKKNNDFRGQLYRPGDPKKTSSWWYKVTFLGWWKSGPFGKVRWPPTRGWKGHRLNHQEEVFRFLLPSWKRRSIHFSSIKSEISRLSSSLRMSSTWGHGNPPPWNYHLGSFFVGYTS